MSDLNAKTDKSGGTKSNVEFLPQNNFSDLRPSANIIKNKSNDNRAHLKARVKNT